MLSTGPPLDVPSMYVDMPFLTVVLTDIPSVPKPMILKLFGPGSTSELEALRFIFWFYYFVALYMCEYTVVVCACVNHCPE